MTPTRDPLLTRIPPLFAKSVWNPKIKSEIETSDLPPLVKAGLHLWNDDLESCHILAQQQEAPGQNYWHAIMHRREGDLENSLYWYHRVGPHPVLQQMKALHPKWSPEDFNRRCQTPEGEREILEKIQSDEMRCLLEWSLEFPSNSAT